MWLKICVCANIIIIVLGLSVRIVRPKGRIDVMGIIKETEDRINKNVYGDTSDVTFNTCGGVYTQSLFLIESPNYPSNYPHNLNCLFIFMGPRCATNYTLQFLDFSLEESADCQEDRLEVQNVSLCGVHEGVNNFYSPDGILMLNFTTNAAVTARGFRILVSKSVCGLDDRDNNTTTTTTTSTPKPVNMERNNGYLPPYPPTDFNDDAPTSFNNEQDSSVDTCGGIFEQPQFHIQSPNYPNNYAQNLNCLFIFRGPYCSLNYTLQFLDFNLEQSLGCSADRLEVKNKDAICGLHYTTKTYHTTMGTLELNFITNEVITARGFKIRVTRSSCEEDKVPSGTPISITPPTSSVNPLYANVAPPKFTPTTTSMSPHTYLPPVEPMDPSFLKAPYPPSGARPLGGDILYPKQSNNFFPHGSKERACCAATYSDKRFYLASPGFPYSYNNPTECSFTIYKANPKVCRMRIHFHYFQIGKQTPFCDQGYLQIDGKLICGCHTGLKLTSPFDRNFGNTKVIRLKNLGLPRTFFSGFSMEIIQDECPKRYAPTDLDTSGFNYYHDQFNRVLWPNVTHQSLQIFPDNTEVFEAVDLGFKPRVVKHVYFFESPPESNENTDFEFTTTRRRDVEETTYFETTDLNAVYPRSDDGKCHAWGVLEWSSLSKELLWQRMPKCSEINVNPSISSCKEYNFIKGYFQSPGYPYYYPKELSTCYRFTKQNGFCKIRLIMLDFQIEDSFECKKDYLLFNGQFRYCGQSLLNTFTQFDITEKNYEEISFKTDSHFSGRGFRGIYEQIPCHHHIIITPPPTVATTTTTTTTYRPPTPSITTSKPPNVRCERKITDDYFTIDIYDYGKEMCFFTVEKHSQDICRLELTFVTFDFPCEFEYLLIDGEKFCGTLNKQTHFFNFDYDNISIMYKRKQREGTFRNGLKLHLVGRQITECKIMIPPAQRIMSLPNVTHGVMNKTMMSMEVVKNPNDVDVVLTRKYKEVCGVVMNVKASYLKDSLCKIILNSKRNLSCSPISENTVYVPYNNTDKLELRFKNSEIVQDIEFKEITCDNKFIV